MSKRVFWPAALIVMGLIFIASSMGYLPASLFNLWPLLLIIVGLGGLLTSDREEWMVDTSKPKATAKKPITKSSKTVAKKSSAAKSAKKSRAKKR